MSQHSAQTAKVSCDGSKSCSGSSPFLSLRFITLVRCTVLPLGADYVCQGKLPVLQMVKRSVSLEILMVSLINLTIPCNC